MIFDIEMIRRVYANLPERIKKAKENLQRPLTLTEKILFSHLSPGVPLINYKRASDYVDFPLTGWRCRMPQRRWPCCS